MTLCGCVFGAGRAEDAGPLLLSLTREHNGTSLSVPGYYTEDYKTSWVIQDGTPLPSKLGFVF